MLRESQSAVVVRNEVWRGCLASEPYEAGWAQEVTLFVLALKESIGAPGHAHVEISPDGIHWAREGTSFALPTRKDGVTFARVGHFGNWLRLAIEMPEGAELTAVATIHTKA